MATEIQIGMRAAVLMNQILKILQVLQKQSYVTRDHFKGVEEAQASEGP